MCFDCREKKTSFEYGYALWVYDQRMQASIGRFKYHGRREYAVTYAKELYRQYGSWIEQIAPQGLVPVPIHYSRYRQRGYNQAQLLAQELSRLTGVPVLGELLERCRDTRPQKELSDRERRQNLQYAFRLKNSGRELNRLPECVILIDDIYTTGSTMEACSKALKEAGISRIFFLCICIGKGL